MHLKMCNQCKTENNCSRLKLKHMDTKEKNECCQCFSSFHFPSLNHLFFITNAIKIDIDVCRNCLFLSFSQSMVIQNGYTEQFAILYSAMCDEFNVTDTSEKKIAYTTSEYDAPN